MRVCYRVKGEQHFHHCCPIYWCFIFPPLSYLSCSIQVLKRIPLHLKMKLKVPQEYIDGFHQANNTFLYQLAFDPMTRRLVPLHPYSDDIDKESLTYAGAYPFEVFSCSPKDLDLHNENSPLNSFASFGSVLRII